MTLRSVSRRTREFGVRMALGAGAASLRTEVLRRTALLAACGIPLGWLLAWISRRFVEKYLFGISPADPWVWIAATLVTAAAALAASLQPASRAGRIDPMSALRED